MNTNPPSPPKSKRRLAIGLTGFGAGILIATIFYRNFAVDDLTDPLRIVGFALLFIGSALTYRQP